MDGRVQLRCAIWVEDGHDFFYPQRKKKKSLDAKARVSERDPEGEEGVIYFSEQQ